MICAHLNINSARNKFELLSDIIKNNIDILMISETKFDSAFPNEFEKWHAIPASVGGVGGVLAWVAWAAWLTC